MLRIKIDLAHTLKLRLAPQEWNYNTMSLLDIPLNKITEADLSNLISNGIPESPVIDYKRDTYENSDKGKREFLADVSSFANTIGGDIIIGMDEEGALPTAITDRKSVV